MENDDKTAKGKLRGLYMEILKMGVLHKELCVQSLTAGTKETTKDVSTGMPIIERVCGLKP